MASKSVRPYHEPAGGWGALKALSEALLVQRIPVKGAATLSRMNQPEGFDCPGCAWPDPKHTLVLRVLRERRQGGRLGSDRQALHAGVLSPNIPSRSCERWSDYELEMAGRLTHPMAYDAASRPLPAGRLERGVRA